MFLDRGITFFKYGVLRKFRLSHALTVRMPGRVTKMAALQPTATALRHTGPSENAMVILLLSGFTNQTIF